MGGVSLSSPAALLRRSWRLVLAGALLLITATGVEADEACSAIPSTENSVEVNINTLAEFRDRDPKTLVIRAFDQRLTARPEGLRSERISVAYSAQQAIVCFEDSGGSLDDSVSSSRYVAILNLDGQAWHLAKARLQWICRPGRGQQQWGAVRCR